MKHLLRIIAFVLIFPFIIIGTIVGFFRCLCEFMWSVSKDVSDWISWHLSEILKYP